MGVRSGFGCGGNPNTWASGGRSGFGCGVNTNTYAF